MVSFFPYFYFIQEKVLFFPYCEFYKAIFSVFEFNLQTPQLWIGLVYPFGNCPCLHFVWIYFYTNWLCSWWQGMLSAVKGIDSDVNCPYVDKKKSGVKGHFHSSPPNVFFGGHLHFIYRTVNRNIGLRWVHMTDWTLIQQLFLFFIQSPESSGVHHLLTC